MINKQRAIEKIFNNFHALQHKMEVEGAHLVRLNHITYSQWFVLEIIEHCGDSSIKQISEMLGISSSAVTQLVSGLVQSGYVMRRDNPKDRRSIQLGLSPKGKQQMAATKQGFIKRLMKLADALSASELETFLRLQEKIISKFYDKNLIK